MENYTHLTEQERYQIFALLRAGHRPGAIARTLQRHPATIGRELKRNHWTNQYSPSQAHDLMLWRRRAKPRRRISFEVWNEIEAKLRTDWSPEQISGWCKAHGLATASPEWIYQRVWRDKRAGGDLHRHLRLKLRRGRRYRTYALRGQIVGRVGIEHRPLVVARKSRIGDWETDTVFGQGHRGVLITLAERKSKFTLIKRVEDKSARKVSHGIIALLKNCGRATYTITSDNGKEFASHAHISQALAATFYFARPYASWERGLNENTNGLLRQYFPKDSDFSTITDAKITAVLNRLNHRPRKTLGFRTPFEVFYGKRRVALRS